MTVTTMGRREQSTLQPKIQIRNLGKIYGRGSDTVEALKETDLDISEGEFVCVVGPSGCGKTTLLRALAGLETPSSGEIQIRHDDGRRTLTAVAFQDYSIFPWKTVAENIAFGLRMKGTPRPEALSRARDWIERFGLGGFEESYPDGLSGGMKQRVSLARAMAVDPEILLLDEPFAALDAQRRLLLQEELLSQWGSDGKRSAVFVTHSLDEAILLGDRVVLMSARPGSVKADWVIPFERPRSPDVRGSPIFAELAHDLWEELRKEVLRTVTEDR